MKQQFTKLLLLGLVLTVFACKKEDPQPEPGKILKLSQTTMMFNTPVDSSITINLESDAEWVALKESSNGVDWFTVTPENGLKSTEQIQVKVSVTANTTSAKRTATVTFSHRTGTVSQILSITQAPKLSKLGQDSMILVELYDECKGWNWKGVWDLDSPLATWQGIGLSAVGGELRVTTLDLQDRGVQGPLPASIQNLTELVTLMSFRNTHGGTLPEWLPNLKKLRYFYIAECGVGGTIPESYYGMTELRQMDLGGNGIKGPLSDKIGDMVNLEELDFAGCPIGGQIPATVQKLVNLTAINMANCKLVGDLLPEIGKLPKLLTIHLDENADITGPIPEMWGECKTLRAINMSHCSGISGELPASLANCPDWWELRVAGAGIEGGIPEEWKDAKSLEYLILYNNKMNGTLPAWTEKPKSLTCLGIGNYQSWGDNENAFVGTLPTWISGLTQIFASGNDFSGPLPASLGETFAMQSLELADNPKLTGDIPVGMWSCPSYTSIILTGNSGLTGQFPADDNNFNLPNLITLDVTDCKMSGPISSKLFNENAIQVVLLANNNFTGNAPITIASKLSLIALTLNGNRLTGEFPAVIAKHPNWLKSMWNPRVGICPQQINYGFDNDSCMKLAPAE